MGNWCWRWCGVEGLKRRRGPLPFSVLLDFDRFESEDFLFFFLEAARLLRLSSSPRSPLPSSLLLPLSLLAAAAPDRRTSISRLICRWFLERRRVSTRLASPSPAEESSSSRPLPSEAFSGDETFGRRRRSGGTLWPRTGSSSEDRFTISGGELGCSCFCCGGGVGGSRFPFASNTTSMASLSSLESSSGITSLWKLDDVSPLDVEGPSKAGGSGGVAAPSPSDGVEAGVSCAAICAEGKGIRGARVPPFVSSRCRILSVRELRASRLSDAAGEEARGGAERE